VRATLVAGADVDHAAQFAVLLRNHNVLNDPPRTKAGGESSPSSSSGGGAGSAGAPPPPVVFSVEIKPKCGFVPATEPRGVSRFRMHQALKVAKGEVSRLSRYDPPDLFCGVGATAVDGGGGGGDDDAHSHSAAMRRRRRARRALLALVSNPQNNLCVRRMDSPGVLFGHGGASTAGRAAMDENEEDTGVRLLALALGSDFCPTRAGDYGATVDVFMDVVIGCLVRSEALSRVLAAQRLDRIGVEGAAELAARLATTRASAAAPAPAGAVRERETPRGGAQTPMNGDDDWRREGEQEDNNVFGAKEEEEEDAVRLLRDFVVAATAKDCSVMLALRRLDPLEEGLSPPPPSGVGHDVDVDGGAMMLIDVPAPPIRARRGGGGGGGGGVDNISSGDRRLVYQCHAAIVDLDMKSVRKLPEWLALERDIVCNYERREAAE
jgi:hypothetical protein